MKEIHFYESETEAVLNHLKTFWNQKTFYYGYTETKDAIENDEEIIHTLQMCCLNTSLFKLGYRIFIHDNNNEYYEIKLGSDNKRTNREIRMEHNLFKLWINGEFDKGE